MNKKIIGYIVFAVSFSIILNFILTESESFIMGLKYITSLCIPLLVGISVAFIVDIPTCFFERTLFKRIKKVNIKRVLSMLLSICLIVGVLLALWFLIIPHFILNLQKINDSMPTAYMEFVTWLKSKSSILPESVIHYVNNMNWTNVIEKVYELVESAANTLFKGVFSFAGSALGYMMNLFVGMILSIYFVIYKAVILEQFDRFISIYFNKYSECIIEIIKLTNKTFRNFITGQCTEAFIFTVLCFIVMSLLDIPYVSMLAPLVGFTCLIPIVGPWIGTIIGAILILMISPMDALLFIVIVIVLQQIEGNLIYPYVVGESVGVPPMLVLLVITFGGSLFGILGILLAVPMSGIILELLKSDMIKKETVLTEKDASLNIINDTQEKEV